MGFLNGGGSSPDSQGGGAVDMVNKIPVLGPLLPNAAGQRQQAAMEEASRTYGGMRAPMAQSRMNAFHQALNALGPANNMLGSMYGQGAKQDLAAAGQNPIAPGMIPGFGEAPAAPSMSKAMAAAPAASAYSRGGTDLTASGRGLGAGFGTGGRK